MAINDIASFSTASNPLELAASSLGGGSSGLGALVGLASGNPIGMITSALSLFGGAQSVKINQTGASGQTVSGVANFGGETAVKFNKPMIDLSEPLHIAIAAAVLVGAIYAFKRFS
jgi:hypothetical protein